MKLRSGFVLHLYLHYLIPWIWFVVWWPMLNIYDNAHQSPGGYKVITLDIYTFIYWWWFFWKTRSSKELTLLKCKLTHSQHHNLDYNYFIRSPPLRSVRCQKFYRWFAYTLFIANHITKDSYKLFHLKCWVLEFIDHGLELLKCWNIRLLNCHENGGMGWKIEH